MSKKVLPFPPISPGLNGTSQTVFAVPRNPFYRVNVVDDLYAHMGFQQGTVFVTQTGKIVEGCIHYVELDGYGFLARLTDCTESEVYVTPFDRETPPGTCSRADLQFVGVLSPEESLNGARPLFEAVAN